jgi:hypothetical protein
MVLAQVDYPLMNLFWTTLIVFAWILWFWLLFRVYADLFRAATSAAAPRPAG